MIELVPADDKEHRFFDHYFGTTYLYLGMVHMLEGDEAFVQVVDKLRCLGRDDLANALQEIAGKKVPPEAIRQQLKEL